MVKTVLVMDMPEQVCQKCALCYETENNEEYLCCAVGKFLPDGEKPDWCPLRELPEKKTSFSDEMEKEKVSGRFDGEIGSGYANLVGKITGWNACLDEILK